MIRRRGRLVLATLSKGNKNISEHTQQGTRIKSVVNDKEKYETAKVARVYRRKVTPVFITGCNAFTTDGNPFWGKLLGNSIGRGINAFTQGNPFWGGKLIGNSIGKGFRALKGLSHSHE